jgi:nucleoside-diphosphate-sugar epimerase
MNMLFLGGKGIIDSHIVDKLLLHGREVRGLLRSVIYSIQDVLTDFLMYLA